MATKWKEQSQVNQVMRAILREAEQGVKQSMRLAAKSYKKGLNGFPKDSRKAFGWYQRAHADGCVMSTANVGNMLVKGDGVEQDVHLGAVLLGQAAALGSNFAAYRLGLYLADGYYGFPVHGSEAKRFLQNCLHEQRCPLQHMAPNSRQEAQEILSELNELYP